MQLKHALQMGKSIFIFIPQLSYNLYCFHVNREGITSEDDDRLNKFGIKSSVRNGIPKWLVKWASLICEFIDFEQEKYPSFATQGHSQEFIAIELKNLRDSKLANIAITINKVIRILRLMGTEEPPIRKMTNKEVYRALWSGSDSVKEQLREVLQNLEPQPEVENSF